MLAEYGLLGLAAILLTMVGGVVLAILVRLRLRRSADVAAAVGMISAAIVFVVQAGGRLVWEETAVTAFALAAIGVVLGRRRRAAPAECAFAPDSSRRGRLRRPWAASQVPGLISTARVRESNDALVAGKNAEALELVDEAIEAEPWSASAYLQRAAVRAADGDPHAAREDVGEAIERDRDYWRPWYALVQIELLRGDRAAA